MGCVNEVFSCRSKRNHLIVNIQRQRLARDWVAVAIVLHRNEVRIVSWREGYGTRRIRAEELGKPPLKKIA